MEEWTIVDLHDDLSSDPDQDRWILIYEVPTEYVGNGGNTFSVSMPKNMITDFAATYGYDLADEDDTNAMWDHLIHLPYLRETARIEGRAHEASTNPYQMTSQAARDLAQSQIADLKESKTISERPTANLSANHLARSVESTGILDHVRQDMIARSDHKIAKQIAEAKDEARFVVQERMIDMAMRMNESTS